MEGLVRVAYLYDKNQYIDTYQDAEAIAKQAGKNIWSIPGYVDEKNGYNMDVVKEDVKDKIKNKLSKTTSNLKEKLFEKLTNNTSNNH